jgi:hypothetical protein
MVAKVWASDETSEERNSLVLSPWLTAPGRSQARFVGGQNWEQLTTAASRRFSDFA